jgi:ubiquitin C-terminal hydrolase|tara:strand:- start:1339 stop:2388 length:1050 start_codon:yes stop_codon:yes gene_type:complete
MALQEEIKYKDKGLTGLANLGNTCYLNSCMQIISHTYLLNDFLDGDYKKRINKKPESVLLVEWDKLRNLMWSENCTVSPAGWVQAVQKVAKLKNRDLFTGWQQNDLPEFLLFLIDSFHVAMQREVEMNIKGNIETERDKLAKVCYNMMQNMYKKEYSEMLNIFYGIHVTQLNDLEGNMLSAVPEPFFMIDLPLVKNKKTINLLDCLNEYYKPERLEGDCQYYNEDKDQKEDVDKGLVVWSFPTILVIALKRFTNNGSKDQRLVTFDIENLDLSKYVKGYNSETYIYDLYGICNHSGGTFGGHYTAYVKNANNNWYHFNDTSVTLIDDNISKTLITQDVYCLFYKKKTFS